MCRLRPVATPQRPGKVILYLPRHVPPEHESSVVLAVPPLPHLALGGSLRQAGYEVRIIDAECGCTIGMRLRRLPVRGTEASLALNGVQRCRRT